MKLLYKVFLYLIIVCSCTSVVYSSGPDGYIIIPSISLYKSIALVPDSDLSPDSHYYDLTNLNDGVGYLENLMWDNLSGGRTIIVGHTPGAFDDILFLEYGDEIVVGMNGGFHKFYVFDKYTTHKSNNDLFVTPPPEFELVLVTCTTVEDERLIIKAR